MHPLDGGKKEREQDTNALLSQEDTSFDAKRIRMSSWHSSSSWNPSEEKGATLRLLLLLCLRHWLLRVNYLISFASLPYFLGSLPLLPGRWMTMGFPFGQSFFLWFRVLQSDPCAELVFPQSNNLSQAETNVRRSFPLLQSLQILHYPEYPVLDE